jgi:hypothetical protein
VNTLTHNGESHDFTTRDELFAIARKFTGTEVTHVYRDGLRVFGFDTRPVMCEIGTSKEPVLFLGSARVRE